MHDLKKKALKILMVILVAAALMLHMQTLTHCHCKLSAVCMAPSLTLRAAQLSGCHRSTLASDSHSDFLNVSLLYSTQKQNSVSHIDSRCGFQQYSKTHGVSLLRGGAAQSTAHS